MEKNVGKLKPRNISIFDIGNVAKLGIQDAVCQSCNFGISETEKQNLSLAIEESHELDRESVRIDKEGQKVKGVSIESATEDNIPAAGLSCSCCKVKFSDLTEQRTHYKLDWHRYNVKLSLQNKPCISEEEFEANYEDGFSSISGSDSETSDDEDDSCTIVNSNGQIFYKTKNEQCFSVYASLLLDDRNRHISSIQPNDLLIENCLTDNCWLIFMLSGGHFAAVVFHKGKVIEHKTFHRYTVRAKSGTLQSVRDGKQNGNAPKSLGANLRRYNEAALYKDINNLFKSWNDHITHSNKIFYRLSAYNKKVFFAGKEPLLLKDDPRVRKIPFMTSRPTFKEIQRVQQLLSSVHFYSSEAMVEISNGKKSRTSEEGSNVEDKVKLRNDISKGSEVSNHISAIEEKNDEIQNKIEDPSIVVMETVFSTIPKDKSCKTILEFLRINFNYESLKTSRDETEESVLKLPPNVLPIKAVNSLYTNRQETLLHLASRNECADILHPLLCCGCDPTVRDGSNRVPYNVCSSKETRDEYRKFMACYPSKYDYQQAQIPSPLTDDMIEDKAKKDKEKKKKQEKERKARQKARKAEMQALQPKIKAENVPSPLSDREKRLKAAEARIEAQGNSRGIECCLCNQIVLPSKSFSKFNKSYCSIECLRKVKTT